MAIVLVMPLMSMAQTKSVRITKFGRSSSLIATMNSVYDNNGGFGIVDLTISFSQTWGR